jgi:hypothetical protein
MLTAWILAHASLASDVVLILGGIVALDHYLASTSQFASNSTAQVVFQWIGNVAGWAQSLLTAPAPAAPAPAPQTPPSAPGTPPASSS